MRTIGRYEILRNIRLRSSASALTLINGFCFAISRTIRFKSRIRTNSGRDHRFKIFFALRNTRRIMWIIRSFLTTNRRTTINMRNNDLLIRVTNTSVDMTKRLLTILSTATSRNCLNVRFRSQSAVCCLCTNNLRRFNNNGIILFVRTNFRLGRCNCFLTILNNNCRNISGNKIFYRAMLYSRSFPHFQIVGNFVGRVSRIFRKVVQVVWRRILPNSMIRGKFFLIRSNWLRQL